MEEGGDSFDWMFVQGEPTATMWRLHADNMQTKLFAWNIKTPQLLLKSNLEGL